MNYRRPENVAEHREEDALYVAVVPGGPIQILDPVAAIIWEEALDGAPTGLVERVAARTSAEPEEIRPHVDAFIADLVERGLLDEGEG